MSNTQITRLPPEIGQLLERAYISFANTPLTFPPVEITLKGSAVTLAYLRDYQSSMIRQTVAALATGVGGLAALILAFRWRQRRSMTKKKRL